MGELIYKEESYQIIGASFEVYRDKGCGFLEAVYQECLVIEFELRGIAFALQPPVGLTYKGQMLKQSFTPDFICYDKIIVELKAVSVLTDEHRSRLLNYMHANAICAKRPLKRLVMA